ncbi:MAG: alcohol dehydrogenase catalytic domain-containing protein, partial [Pseudomonadota bacterium]|nr:alcohol dehydrogenase catalytic domain-containing protein [Pseudomonadota bacterium]
MIAIAVRGDGRAPESLVAVEAPRPAPGAGEVLIRVRAAGVNRADILQRQGRYPPPPGAPETLGLEVAGEVAELGPGAPRWRQGDRVAALLAGGGYAEYAAVDARCALPV